MIEFYLFGEKFQLAILMVTTFCVIIQSLALVIGWYRYRSGWVKMLENLFEGIILIQTILISMLIAQVRNAEKIDLIISSGFILSRFIVFFIIISIAIMICIVSNNYWSLIVIVASSFTLPAAEQITKKLFPIFYITAIVFFTLRGIYVCILRYKELKTNISNLSVKEAIDALKEGILFCDENGYILLANRTMQRLMFLLTGKIQRNAKQFYEQLSDELIVKNHENFKNEGQLIYRLPDGSSWMFTDTTILIRNKQYRQISAADITQQWNAATQLKQQNTDLKKRSEELKTAIENMKIICREEEMLRAKSRIHDILGQRLALLMRALREHNMPDINLFNIFKNGLPNELKEPPNEIDFKQEITTLSEIFHGIGVMIDFKGEFPKTYKTASFFMEIITEAVTNAVRHGFSTEVKILCEKNEENWMLKITDNGLSVNENISEGGGIGNIRRKISEELGTLYIQVKPNFVLQVFLPRRVT